MKELLKLAIEETNGNKQKRNKLETMNSNTLVWVTHAPPVSDNITLWLY